MTKFTNPFVLDNSEYSRDINILDHYVTDVSTFLSIQKNIPFDKAKEYVLLQLSKEGKYPFKDKPIKYLERQSNGDRIESDGGLWEYLSDSIKKEQLISPTLTTYIPAKEKVSLLSTYIDYNVKGRSKAKKEKFIAKANGDNELAVMKDLEQSNKKIANNSVSGAVAVASTSLYNKTSHSTLTSNCRSTSAYGNANNEKVLSGNRHYYNHHIVIANIISICNNTNYDLLKKVMSDYNIIYPTVFDVLDSIKYSTLLYWKESFYFNKIEQLVYNLRPEQRAAFLYTGDLYHIKKYNDSVVRDFINNLSMKVTGTINNPLEVLSEASDDHISLVHQICFTITKGIGKNHNKLSYDSQCTLALTYLNVLSTLNKYSSFIKVFFVTKNVPTSISHIPTSIRRTALTSDTDSTIFTVQDWVLWKNGKIGFEEIDMAVAASLIFFASATVTHILAIMSSNFGIEKDKLNVIAMKNEFKFDVFVPTSIGKHYFAYISCQEGNVFNHRESEIKGVNLKSSKSSKVINNTAKLMMEKIMTDTMSGKEIVLIDYLKEIAIIEKNIIKSINSGETTYFKLDSIKNPDGYKKDKTKSPYVRHVFWNTVFGPTYGVMDEPPYGTVKINVTTENKTDFINWINKIKNKDLANRLTEYMRVNEKTHIPTFFIPIQKMNNGLPVELIPIINYRKIIIDNCGIFYMILETLGLYIHGDKTMRIVSDDY